MYTNLLLTTDGSELAERALADGLALAKSIGAKVTILAVSQPLHAVGPSEIMIAFPAAEYDKGAKKRALELLSRAEINAKQLGIVCKTVHLVHEHAWQAIIDTAVKEGCDLIVMGSHGRSGIAQLVLGSQTQKVLTHSSIPVLVHR